ncbi:MAG: hypothetical protein U0X74_06185 [Anaerolineales bacterium]
MEVSRIENLPPPPGIISSIKAGFDVIASHILVILLPLALNLGMWLGPRLQMDALFKSLENDMVSIWQASQIPADQIQSMITSYETMTQSANLFQLLRTFPIGIPVLFAPTKGPFTTPLGDPAILQVNGLTLLLWFFLLTGIGWIIGAIYFRIVAGVTFPQQTESVHVLQAIFQTILISIVGNLLLFALSMPIFFILLVAMQVSTVLANLVVLFVALGSVWVIVPLFFWAHGVFLKRQNVLTSILSSIKLTRFTLPTSSLFVLTVFLLSYGLNYLWRLPSLNSWLTLLGLFGHSFVTTALLASSFIYYYEMSAWVQTVLDKLRPNNIIKQA